MREEPPESKRIKLEVGATSPASSHQSMKSDWSMEPPGNSSGGNPPLMPSMKQEPSVASCPESVKREQPHSGATPPDRVNSEKAASPGSSCLSMKSDWSMDPPQNFRGGNSPIMPSLLTEDHFRCSVCTEVLKDPVSIPCGHSYCRQCITSYWAQPNHAGLYTCPQCSHTYNSWPELYTNTALAQVVKKLQHFSPALPVQCSTDPGDVCCDFCTGRKLRAVKSCLTCSASYCESHIRQHYTVPVLQRHTLVEPENQEEKDKEQLRHLKENESQCSDDLLGTDVKTLDGSRYMVDGKNCMRAMEGYVNMFKNLMEQQAKVLAQQEQQTLQQQFEEQQMERLQKLQQTLQQQFEKQQMKTLQKLQQTMQQQFEEWQMKQMERQQKLQQQIEKRQMERLQKLQQQFEKWQMERLQKLQQTIQQQFEEQQMKKLQQTMQQKPPQQKCQDLLLDALMDEKNSLRGMKNYKKQLNGEQMMPGSELDVILEQYIQAEEEIQKAKSLTQQEVLKEQLDVHRGKSKRKYKQFKKDNEQEWYKEEMQWKHQEEYLARQLKCNSGLWEQAHLDQIFQDILSLEKMEQPELQHLHLSDFFRNAYCYSNPFP